MSGGGSTTTQSADPWSGAQPYLRDLYGRAFTAANNPAEYYPGATYLGPTQGQLSAWDQQLNYADQVFGGANAPRFGEATGAVSGALTGGNTLGQLSGSLAPFANQRLQQAFSSGSPTFNPAAFTPNENFNPAAFTPNVTGASGVDTSAAFGRALSGTPDYSGLQASIDAANTPLLRQFEQDLLPGLNQRATFLGNPTGGIKTLNRVLPELGERMSMNAATITEAERQRALAAQQQAAQYLTGAGLQGAALGQQGAGTAANLGLQGYGLGLQGAQQAANLQSDYRNQLLGLGNLGAGLAGQQSGQALQAASMFPSLVQSGQMPGQFASSFANWGAGYQNQALQDQMARWNYYQNLPAQTLQQYSGLLTGAGGLGGQSTSTTRQGMGMQDWASLALGVMAYASDRRLKTDIERVGTLDSGLAVYRYRYKGDPRFQIGVMADEVRGKFPDAVQVNENGFDMVDYRKVA